MRYIFFAFYVFAFLITFVSCKEEDKLTFSPEEGEELSGGAATTYDFSFNAFGHEIPELTAAQHSDFVTGNSFFKLNWVTAPASTQTRDGLGPILNAASCSSCHNKDGRGALPEPGEQPMGLLFRVGMGNSPHPQYGSQLQNRGVLGVAPEAEIFITYEEIIGQFTDGTPYTLRKPQYEFRNEAYGGSMAGASFSPRIGPQLIGMGLLEAIPEETILAWADEADADGDGISGRPNYVWDVQRESQSLGRFGWKANEPTVLQQTAGAFNGDIGITTSLFPREDFTAAQAVLEDLPNGGIPEIPDTLLRRVVFYTKVLAVPARRDVAKQDVLRGKVLFQEAGCSKCHKMNAETGNSPYLALRYQQIHPYTDLLLHDMGEELADNKSDFLASGTEWRTPPLWGLGLLETVNGYTFLMHDGRARNIQEAILWHGGEGEASKKAFVAMTKSEREGLLAFLNSL